MPKEEVSTEETKKTAVVLGIGNLILAPLYAFNAKIGFTASLALTGAALYQLHELGKSERPVPNALNQTNNFFSSQTGTTSADINNAVSNIVKGGTTIFDKFVPR